MFDSIISSFTQAIKKNGYNVAVFMLIAFLIWQVTNHIPTQMDRIESKMDSQYKELRQDITRLEGKMDRLEDKMDKLNERMDKLLYYLIDNKGKN